MEIIKLVNTLPRVFENRNDLVSEIWNKTVVLQKGRYYLVEANSGNGKSSMLSFIYGFRNDYIGDIYFDNDNVADFKKRQWTLLRNNNIALMWQELRLFPELTAMENVMIKNSITHFQNNEKIKEWFCRLDIEDKMNVKVAKMSYGQQQRVALIRTLCQPFDFLFLDEPVSHIDHNNALIMAQIVKEEVKKQNAALVVTSIGERLDLNYDNILKL